MPVSMSTRHMRNSWRGQTGLPAGFPQKYGLRNTVATPVATPVTPASTPRRPIPFGQYRSPPTLNRLEWSPPHQPGKIPIGWNSLPCQVSAANPSSLICYGQEGWYPRRDPTTRLAALDEGRIPNRKGTSHCVNDNPAPGQG